MMKDHPDRRRIKPREAGFMLLAAMFMLALLVISLAIALPRMAKEIQRDREVETMERGKQYIRGVRMYYKKFGRYPPNVDALVKSNEIRFLRKKYKDPTTGKEEWKPIQFGQNKAPTAMGFFGQPLAGSSMGGCNGIAGASTVGSSGSLTSVTDGATDVSGGGNIGGCSGATGATGSPSSTDTSGATTSTTPSTSPTTSGLSSSTSTSSPAGQTFGGAGIIGFSPNSPKPSILVYKKKRHYNEWEFVYDPISEQMMVPGSGSVAGANPAVPTTVASPSPSPTPSPSPQ